MQLHPLAMQLHALPMQLDPLRMQLHLHARQLHPHAMQRDFHAIWLHPQASQHDPRAIKHASEVTHPARRPAHQCLDRLEQHLPATHRQEQRG